MFETMTIEMSLKPFRQVNEEYIARVCRKAFEQWKPLLKHAQTVSVMLWAADGSEILDYDGELDREFEWCKYVGGANCSQTWNPETDPEHEELHSQALLYIDNPPQMTYRILKNIVATLKRVGREVLGDIAILVGETFDPGPEFARSEFKYQRHPEVCFGKAMGANTFMCCYASLKGDTRKYAGFPSGIPDGTPVGTFLGRQAQAFLTDMGFDYLWLSNGFGFGLDPWHTSGPMFDGEKFDAAHSGELKEAVLNFWRLFRAECPDFPVWTRGTNFSVGIDCATDGFSVTDLYEGGFHILPPPNSPWAALDGNFGLELVGYMSRIAVLPDKEYLFRYYIHDPWWVNTPWYDRYEGNPHDIYLPLSNARIDENGKMQLPTHLNLLSIDNSFGEMPESCVNEPLPHLLKAMHDAPDQPSPLVWVYPVAEYSKATKESLLQEMFFGDWYMAGAINNGFPLASIVSTGNFVKTYWTDASLYMGSVLVSPVPFAGSETEKVMLDFIQKGGKALFYGNTERASEKFLQLINIRHAEPISGELEIQFDGETDELEQGTLPSRLIHRGAICSGGMSEVLAGTGGAKPIGYAGERLLGTYTERVVWLRGTYSAYFGEWWWQLLGGDDPKEYFLGEAMPRYALAKLGYEIGFEKIDCSVKSPVLMVSRNNNGFQLSAYAPNTTVQAKLKFPLGAPICYGMDTRIRNGRAVIPLAKSFHAECRVFVEQEHGVVVCKEVFPCSSKYRRKTDILGLKNATVRIFPETYCAGNMRIVLNGTDPFCSGDEFEGEWKDNGQGRYFEIRHVTGRIRFSMPMRRRLKPAEF